MKSPKTAPDADAATRVSPRRISGKRPRRVARRWQRRAAALEAQVLALEDENRRLARETRRKDTRDDEAREFPSTSRDLERRGSDVYKNQRHRDAGLEKTRVTFSGENAYARLSRETSAGTKQMLLGLGEEDALDEEVLAQTDSLDKLLLGPLLTPSDADAAARAAAEPDFPLLASCMDTLGCFSGAEPNDGDESDLTDVY